MPAPPARMRSASVPCGLNSSSSSPARILLREQLVLADIGRDHLLDLARLQQQAEADAVDAGIVGDRRSGSSRRILRIASISVSGMPHRPKPPDMIVMPSFSRPANALRASGYTFFMSSPYLPNSAKRSSGTLQTDRFDLFGYIVPRLPSCRTGRLCSRPAPARDVPRRSRKYRRGGNVQENCGCGRRFPGSIEPGRLEGP